MLGKGKQNGNSLKPDSSLHVTKQDRRFLQNTLVFLLICQSPLPSTKNATDERPKLTFMSKQQIHIKRRPHCFCDKEQVGSLSHELSPSLQWTHTSDEQCLPSSRYAWSRFCSCLIVTPAGNTSFWSLTGGPFFAARWPEAVCCWITVGYELGLNLCAWLTWGWLGLATLDVKFSQHMMCWNSWWLPHLSCWLFGE